MAIKELFQDDRPEILFDPRASRRIDPRIKYTRDGAATYTDRFGVLQPNGAPAGAPRFNYDPITNEYLGLLREGQRTNYFTRSAELDTAFTTKAGIINPLAASTVAAPDGTLSASSIIETTANSDHYVERIVNISANQLITFSIYVRQINSDRDITLAIFADEYSSRITATFNAGSMNLVRTSTAGFGARVIGRVEPWKNGWYRISVSGQPTTNSLSFVRVRVSLINVSTVYTGNGTSGFRAWAGQVEDGYDPTSYIPTPADAAVTRAPDIISFGYGVPSQGTLMVDSKASHVTEDSVIASIANASNQKVNLAYESREATYNSLSLVASYTGSTKTSLPLPVPTDNRERNVITWGAQNYQYGQSFSRYVPSLSSSVPVNMDRIFIGSDAVDPTKAFNGHINRIYLWAGEMQPAVAEALVRAEVDAVNADTYSPVGPSGSLALIINTQGASEDGSRVFTLPAARATTTAGNLIIGQTYRILDVGTTDFTLVGATANTVGVIFIATGTTTGTGTAAWQNDIVVTWGDTTQSGLEGAEAEVGAVGLVHTYPTAGIYPVWVEGRMQNIYYNNIADAADVVLIQEWGTNDMFRKPTTMNGAFYGCSKMDFSATARVINLPDTSTVSDWTNAFRGGASITGTFPQFNYTAATTLSSAFRGCEGFTTWPNVSTQTQNVTNMANTFDGCRSLATLPLISTQNVTTMSAFIRNCSSLLTIPLLNTQNVTNFDNFADGCSSLTSIPLLNTAAATTMAAMLQDCTSLVTIPLFNTANVTNFSSMMARAAALTSLPLLNTANGTNFSSMISSTSISALPALAFTNAVTGTPASPGGGFFRFCSNCSLLTTVPANLFNGVTNCTQFAEAFNSCALTAASIENILVSINTANTSNGELGLIGGTNAAKTTWTTAANNAYNNLIARGWTITFNP
jgi:hypothetical protein